MTRASSSFPPLGRLWKTLTSLRLTLVVLMLLAVVSLVGTVRSEVFDTIWFLAPLALLCLNLTACLIHGLPQALRRCRGRLTPQAALELPERARFVWPPTPEPHAFVEAALRRELGRVQKSGDGEHTVYFSERGRFRPLGPYVVHLALLVILAGALLGRFWGVEGSLTLREGETAATFTAAGKKLPLGVAARLDRFQMFTYPDGTPREFRSDLTFTGPGQAPEKAACRVNHPVTAGDYTFYQSSYGYVLRLKVTQGDNSRIIEAPMLQTVALPDSKARIRVLEYQPDLVMPGMGQELRLGPAARIAYWEEGDHPRLVVVVKNRPELADKQPGPHRFYLEGAQYFSVLQVKRDPGVWLVYAGFLLLLPGFYLAFLRPAERWALTLGPNPRGGWEARLLGAAPRARESFQERRHRLQERLEQGGKA
jgi:cytochrome c biogenesis protein